MVNGCYGKVFLPEGIFIFTDTRTFVKILTGYIKYGCKCNWNDLVLLHFNKGIPIVEYPVEDIYDKISDDDWVEVNGKTGVIEIR